MGRLILLISNNLFNIRFCSGNAHLTSRSKFNRFFAFVFIVTIVENPFSHRYVEEKRISIVKALSDTRHQFFAKIVCRPMKIP